MKTPYVVVPEHIVRDAAEACTREEGFEVNTFHKMLLVGEEYKQANMTPIYLFNPATAEVFVHTKEQMENKLQ